MSTENSETTAARQMESIKLDNLLINFTTEFNRIWDTNGSDSKPGAFWRPIPAPDLLPGFFPLGDVAVSGYDNINGSKVVAVVRDAESPGMEGTRGKALSQPIDFQPIWKDAGSGARKDCTLWRPVPPEGYVALGLVCSNHEKPLLSTVRCVREDLVIASNLGDLIWEDKGSGAKQNFSSWSIEPPSAAAGEIYFAPGTFVGFNSYTKPSLEVAGYSLRMQIPIQAKSAPELPVISGFEAPPDETSETTQVATIPWFAVKDHDRTPIERMNKSPYYRLKRTDQYTLVGYGHNNGEKSTLLTWTAPRILSRRNQKRFSKITSIEVSSQWPTATSGARPLNFSAKLSADFTHTKTSSSGWMSSNTVVIAAIVPENKMLAVYQLESHYTLLREDDTDLGVIFSYADADSLRWIEYPSEKENEAPGSKPMTEPPVVTDTAP
ncbi:TPA: Vps62-related protein [Pseudomonas putida]|nr:Vps62-related protein [Pseudomonas putida]